MSSSTNARLFQISHPIGGEPAISSAQSMSYVVTYTVASIGPERDYVVSTQEAGQLS